MASSQSQSAAECDCVFPRVTCSTGGGAVCQVPPLALGHQVPLSPFRVPRAFYFQIILQIPCSFFFLLNNHELEKAIV